MSLWNRRVPRYWPILFILDCAGTLRNNFHLQKILYLAQVERHIPIPYAFVRETYGPYSRAVKADFITLANDGLIDLRYGVGWVFTITDKGRKAIREMCMTLDEKVLKEFRACVDEWSRRSLHDLKRYIYEKHLPSKEAYLEEKADLAILAETLMASFESYPISSNRLVLVGDLDYVIAAFGKEKIGDPVHGNHFLRAAARLLDHLDNLFAETSTKPTILRELSLAQLREDFDQFQETCQLYHVLPPLYDESTDLADLIR